MKTRYFKIRQDPRRKLLLFDILYRLRPRCKYLDEQWEGGRWCDGRMIRKHILNNKDYIEISESDLMLERL